MPSAFDLYPFQSGQQVVLRKKHPCGGSVWEITRAGAEITARCVTCGHSMRMKRRAFERAVRSLKEEENGHE